MHFEEMGCLFIQQLIYFYIVFLNINSLMRPKQRIRKIYTQSDISDRPYQPDQNMIKTNNINIKDLELNISDTNLTVSDSKNNRNFMYKNAHFYMPNKFNKINRKQLIKKLPDINLTSLNTIARPPKLSPLDDRSQDRFSNNKKNTFLLNPLFQILKPEDPHEKTDLAKIKQRTLKIGQKKNISIDSFYQNQFINVTNSSTKNRGPKIIENQITRLSNHNNIMRRKIVSEEKSRPKYRDKSIQKLKETTFEHFKRHFRQEEQCDLRLSQNVPKQNFQNLEIITFYNKFPTLKKKEEQRQSQPLKTKQMRQQSQVRQGLKHLKSKMKTQQTEYQEQNEFIFEKR